jgi:hypothetical protein
LIYSKWIRAIILAILVIGSCAKDPFSARHSEPPLGSAGTWETPQSPEVVVRNLLFAYNERNISNYQLCFSDSFIFSAPEDSIDAVNAGRPELFADWNKQVEVATATNIFTTFSGTDTMAYYLTLTSAPDQNDIIEDSTATLFRDYALTIVLTGVGQPDTIEAAGLATFHLNQELLNWWTIGWWEDLPAQTAHYDWGDFKAEYR